MDIDPGRRALITGGASGFGLEIARRLAAAGVAVGIVDLDGDRIAAALRLLGDGAVGEVADVRRRGEVVAAAARVAGAFGGLDTVVISAGVFHHGALDDITEAEWDRTIDVNMKGAFLTVQATAPELRRSGRGRVVTIGSDCSRRGFALESVYTASKFGLLGLTESLAAELAGDGVTVNCVCPVGVPTTGMGREVLAWKVDHSDRSADEIVAGIAKTNPLGRNPTERDVADAVLFFLSEHSSFLTGIALDVDGGSHLGSVPGAS